MKPLRVNSFSMNRRTFQDRTRILPLPGTPFRDAMPRLRQSLLTHQMMSRAQDWLRFSLSLGERAGVRASLSLQLNRSGPEGEGRDEGAFDAVTHISRASSYKVT